jgi:GTPase SAR1 family protein
MRLPFLFKKRNLGDSGDIIVTVAGIESVIPKEKPYQGLADMQRKLVFVGDCGSGKTCLIV